MVTSEPLLDAATLVVRLGAVKTDGQIPRSLDAIRC
jgi:hypothetical protein